MTKASYHHGNLHEALLQAARELLADSGVEDLSLRKLARAAGVSATAPYSHFRDKQSLLAELATIPSSRSPAWRSRSSCPRAPSTAWRRHW